MVRHFSFTEVSGLRRTPLRYHRPCVLDPHASDGGLFRNEEDGILSPAVRTAKEKGITVVGPVPADSASYFGLQGKHDVVVSLYHNQEHIASKTYDILPDGERDLRPPLHIAQQWTMALHSTWPGRAPPTQ